MIYVSSEFKEAFLSAEQKNLVLTFDDGTVIDNEDIALESMELEQTLCDNDELRFGKVASACFKIKIKASIKRYKNLWFNATLGIGEHEIQLGRFKVYADNMTSDRLYRDIVAYDALFWAINTDVTEWYNELSFPITQKAFRDSLFTYLGIEQEVVQLPNDSITFIKTIDAEILTGLDALQKLCEINATCGTINNVGKFKYVRMRTHEHDALYPSDNLYPSDTLYPNDIYDDRLSKGNYYQGTLKYEEYDTQPITKVTIREDADDIGYSYGTDGNVYVIEDNFLLYGASDNTLETVAKNFYDYAQYIAYTPSQFKTKGAPWREVGDLLRVAADKHMLVIPILNRRLSGITALNDTYIAKGKEKYSEVISTPTEKLKQLKSRTNKLTRTLDETKSELKTFETVVDKSFKEVSSTITQTANSIKSEVKETYETKTDAANSYKELSSSITQTAEEISSEVRKKVGNDEIISKINQSAEAVEINAEKIKLEGLVTMNGNFKVLEDGSIVSIGGMFDDCEVEGVINASELNLLNGFLSIVCRSGEDEPTIDLTYITSSKYEYAHLDVDGLVFSNAENSYSSDEKSVELLASRDLIFYVDDEEWGTWLDETGVWSESLTISGTKSRVASTENFNNRLFYCYETPTPTFGDLGEGQIDDTGKCYVFIDDIFSETIDTDCVYQVFLQPYGKGECYVTERNPTYFIVEGSVGLSFGWELKAVQKGFDTMRMEVFEKPVREASSVSETIDYLISVVDTDNAIEETEEYLNSLTDTDIAIEENEEYLNSVTIEESEDNV